MKYILVLLLIVGNGCSTCRGVMGAQYHPVSHIVEEILPDSPAEKSGVVLGDILINPEALKGRPGETKWIYIDRKGQLVHKEIKLECLDDLMDHFYEVRK